MWREEGAISFGAIIRDVTERRRHEDRLYHLAHHDQLTGLANRSVLRSRVQDEVSAGRPTSLVMVDLEGFKEVNDTLGHVVGDALLRETAVRLTNVIRPQDMAARLDSDEFALLLMREDDPLKATGIAESAIAELMRPFELAGQQIHIAASAGVAIYPAQCGSAEELLGNADLALSQAKREGRGRRTLFTSALRDAVVARRNYDLEIRRAVENDELRLFFQPQVDLHDGRLVGAEALIRWEHPERGLLPPAAFLPVLEAGPLAAAVGDWVLDTACAQAAAWRAAGAGVLRMGVNLFAAQLGAGDPVDKVQAVLARHELPPGALEIEITENIALDEDDSVLPPLRALKAMGVGIAFDDYGTGFASLSLLKRFPLTRLKIDQSFVRAMCSSPADAAIVQAVTYLGESFGLDVIAEGIETEEQKERLLRKGCTEGQGYLFGRPMPPADFASAFGFGAKVRAA